MTEQHLVPDHNSGTLSDLDRRVVELVPPGGNWKDLPQDFPSKRVQQIRESAAAGKGSRSTYYGRLTWDRPAYTISTYITRPGNGCHIHPEYDRLITTREAARFQSFPDSVHFTGSNRARTKQVGNAVPPLLAYAVASILEPGRFVDLFSGAGGLSLGFQWAGHELVRAVDFDEDANETARLIHGSDRVVTADLGETDVFEATMRSIRTAAKTVDILVGGPPCQGFSTAGKGDLSDDRNKLVFAFLRAVEELQPRVVLMENVPALMWRGKEFLAHVRRELHELGYGTSTIIAHAEGYGVPQLRRRMLLQAVKGGTPSWPTPTHQIMDPAFLKDQPGSSSGGLPTTTVRDAIFDLPPASEASADTLAVASAAESNYQRWARGELDIHDLIGNTEVVPTRQPGLFSPAPTSSVA